MTIPARPGIDKEPSKRGMGLALAHAMQIDTRIDRYPAGRELFCVPSLKLTERWRSGVTVARRRRFTGIRGRRRRVGAGFGLSRP